jgi:CRISPR-associated endonuclease/helicase Cas3
MVAFAHSKPGYSTAERHKLEDHLKSTASLAQNFAELWGAGQWGYLAGLWHDLGKFSPEWQEFLLAVGEEANDESDDTEEPPRRKRRGPPHSATGSLHARAQFGKLGLPLQFAIAAHHAGLPDKTGLDSRLAEEAEGARYRETLAAAMEQVLRPGVSVEWPPYLLAPGRSEERNRRLETFIRMLLSALADADFLDTEAFFEAGSTPSESRTELRKGWRALSEYEPILRSHLNHLEATCDRSKVNERRRQVLRWCLDAGAGPQGTYTLTVPTGGGKTLSGLAFALSHARRHSLSRVVMALPFLSIVDQTASKLREIFGPLFGERALLEHHSSIDPVREKPWNRLAAENWDAPLIVTTQVQLLESLFSNRPSSCRKLHNLAGSVVVLDEAQSLPVSLIAPILDQLQQLAADYRVTLLLMTATQPALHRRQLGSVLFPGLHPQPREIVPEGTLPDLFRALKRVRIIWPESKEPVAWPNLARELATERQVLAVVHRRVDARELWRALSEVSGERPLHLSALMCAAHRQGVLAEIRERLRAGASCRVVSTQLIEAGVDVDFPVVYRAMAGLESLAQTAGRCNREGKLTEGRLRVFHAPTEPPRLLQEHRNLAASMLEADPTLDLDDPAVFRAYFDRLYASHSLDARGIQALRKDLRFRETATRFRVIYDATVPITVPYGLEGRRALDALRFAGPSRETLRGIQRFVVSIYPEVANRMKSDRAIELIHDTVWALRSDADYDQNLGLVEPTTSEPLIA